MDVFNELISIADTLLGPNGCSWDKEQTLDTLQRYLLEEMHELLEAMDQQNNAAIQEEMGDCFYTLIFVAKLAEQKNMFTISDVLRTICAKLIRRHPHIFGSVQVSSTEDIVRNWEAIKKQEGKKNPIAGIPSSLPALARSQKVISKICGKETSEHHLSEEEIGRRLWEIVKSAQSVGVDAESALRRYCLSQEGTYRNN